MPPILAFGDDDDEGADGSSAWTWSGARTMAESHGQSDCDSVIASPSPPTVARPKPHFIPKGVFSLKVCGYGWIVMMSIPTSFERGGRHPMRD